MGERIQATLHPIGAAQPIAARVIRVAGHEPECLDAAGVKARDQLDNPKIGAVCLGLGSFRKHQEIQSIRPAAR